MQARPPLVLLGPQRFQPNLRETLRELGVDGPVAAITAGWQERESEIRELSDHLARETRNLELYRRHDDVVLRDPELGQALRERQDQLQRLQALYRIRLEYGLDAVRRLMADETDGAFLAEHRRDAIRAVRTLDRHHIARLRRLHEAFDAEWRPAERPVVAAHRAELEQLLDGCPVLAIAGGHVAVLLSRMRLFGIPGLVCDRMIVAWSAGAMALADRVVLFHDSPPQGAGNPEVLDAGLALHRSLVVLPDARHRLELADPVRVAIFARRFSPAICAVLDDGARIDWDGARWHGRNGTRRLGRGGAVRKMA